MDYAARIGKFQQAIGGKADISFFPISADLQYLAGIPRDNPCFGAIMHPGAWVEGLWMTPAGKPVLALTRMSAEFGGVEGVGDIDVRILGDHDDPAAFVRKILEDFNLSGEAVAAISDRTLGETITGLNGLLPGLSTISGTDFLRPMRAVKTPDEIALMKKSGEITEAAFADTIAMMKPGMTELDAIAEVNYQLRRHGSLGQSFPTVLYCSSPTHPLIFGKSEITQNRVMESPITILFDFGAIVEGYCYDFGRTVFFGDPSDEVIRIHRVVMDSQHAGIEVMKSGQVRACDVDKATRDVVEANGYGEQFRHRLGHGIGLDVHEPPFLTASDDSVIQKGMLFTVEPSITQFNDFSARVEDVVMVGDEGGEPLTKGFQDLIVIS